MHDSKIESRLKAQLSKFCCELCAGLSKPLRTFASQMLFGIQASQDVKLSNIARSLKEKMALIETQKRLSRNLKADELEKELTPQLAKMGSQRVRPNTVLALDLSDVRKELAGGHRRIRRGAADVAHKRARGSAGLAIGLVDRANLPDALEN